MPNNSGVFRLLELSFCGVGLFVEKQTINFENLGKLVQVDGVNTKTNGSSGSGKSTVFHCLDYLFDTNSIPTSSLQSRFTKEKIWVSGTFRKGDSLIKITRSKKDGLVLNIDGKILEGSIAIIEEKLDELLGVSRKLFEKLIHKKQKEHGFFLYLTAGESYSFLTKVLGLEEWTTKIENINKQVTLLNTQKDKLITEIKFNNDYILKNNQAIAELASPTKLVTEYEDLKLAKDELNRLKKVNEQLSIDRQNELSKITEEPLIIDSNTDKLALLKQEIDYLKKIIKEKENEKNIKLADINSKINVLNKELYQIGTVKRDILQDTDKITKAKAEINHIESSNCPTCLQFWNNEGSKNRKDKLTIEIKQLIQKILSSREIVSKEEAIENSIKTLQLTVSDSKFKELYSTSTLELQITEKNNLVSAMISNIDNAKLIQRNKLSEQRNNISSQYAAQIDVNNTEIGKIYDKFNSLTSIINKYESDLRIFNSSKDQLNQSNHVLESKKTESEQKLKEIEESVSLAEESKTVIKSYTLKIFQESLDFIGDKASSILANIPNMANCHIYFESLKENKNGSTKEEINAIININGEDSIPIKTLSGGERTALNLAIDLAMIDMIEMKTGKGVDFFILDEPFTGLDTVSSEAVVNLLNTLDTNKRIIIVDHNPVIKEIITDKIVVTRKNDSSTVEVV